MRPLFAKSGTFKAGTDPIEILKAQSFDPKGYEILRILKTVLSQPYVKIIRGPTTLFEWPAFGRRTAAPKTEMELLEQWSCVRFADLKESNRLGRPRVMRIGIAADGVWHYFWSED